ncbi:hypothetical protein LNP74_26340 [Klebsiella pneumoniae subsp. pneumoniae]|nr:hypothetical protein [Klebsiella pneumoniae subsp. pneumoniae]
MSKSHPRWRMAKRVLDRALFIAVIVLLVILRAKSRLAGRVKVIHGYDRLAFV